MAGTGGAQGRVAEAVAEVAVAQGTRLDEDTAVQAARLFKALSDPIRVRLLALVRQTAAGEACFCDLATEFDMPQSSLSHHLKILVAAGILERERRGTWSWYRVRQDPLAAMEGLLSAGGPLRDSGCCE